VGHVVAASLFYLLTARLLEGDLSSGFLPAILPIPWIAAGAAAVILLTWISVPLAVQVGLARDLAPILLGGLVLGSTAFGLGCLVGEEWPFWEPMAHGTLWVANRLLGLVFVARVYKPDELVLGTEAFPVQVTQYCSGYEGISLFLIFFCVFLALWREKLRFPQALLLLPLGILSAWLLNAFRIAALVVVGTLISPKVAMDGFHVFAGWPLLCGVALGCVALGTRLSLFSKAPTARREGVNPTGVYLGPLLAWTAAAMVAGAFSSSPEGWYPARMVPVLLLLFLHRREHAQLAPAWSWSAAGLGVAAFVVWVALLKIFPIAGASTGSAEGVGVGARESGFVWSALWWTIRIAGTCLVTPIVEELAFRGYLTRRLVSADFERVQASALTWRPCLLSSFAFGLLHKSWPAGVAAGLIYAFAYRRRGRLFDAVLAHAATNTVMVAVVLATGDQSLWG
jgi:exosortase E/protease (VPEID-CTERM system)